MFNEFFKNEDNHVEDEINMGTVNMNDESVSDPEPVFGKVVGCSKLNVRKEPFKNSEVVCVVDSGAELMVEFDESNESWLKVCTEQGMEGYCMKEYVSL